MLDSTRKNMKCILGLRQVTLVAPVGGGGGGGIERCL